MTTLFARAARLPSGWARDVRIGIGAGGTIATVQADSRAQSGDEILGSVLPGMTNLHSHAFQRAMAGLTEVASGAADDDFWSWREWMYRFMSVLTPDDIEAIAAQLYVENLKGGYTSVVEFHYLHNAPDGSPYADCAETSERILAAARDAGIAMTLAPVLYTWGGFGRVPLKPHQLRFRTDVDTVLAIVEKAGRHANADCVIGAAPHSLRAAECDQIRALVRALPPGTPIHIHAAEQVREIEDCVAHTGRRPVRLLLDEAGVDARWCLVHATHMMPDEVRGLAESGAVAGLCPSTEADLGDGIFPFGDYAGAGGAWGLGGDSNVCRSPFEELKLVEWVQRLAHRRRNLAAREQGAAIADHLWDAASAGGARASGRMSGAIAPGRRADLIVVALEDAAGAAYSPGQLLNQAVFGGGGARVTDAMVGGAWRLRGSRHPAEERIAARHAATMRRLLA